MKHALLFAASLIAPSAAHAATVTVDITNVRNDHGHVLVAICSSQQFLLPRCSYTGSVNARVGSVSVKIGDVTPGKYAVQAFHDENDNKSIDRNFLGIPVEGMGFSNNAAFHFGPPYYSEAEISVADPTTKITIRLRYLG